MLTLLIMNNRVAWVGERFRASLALNVVLAAALAFFVFTAAARSYASPAG